MNCVKFFIWSSIFFPGDLVIIEDQLIFIFYEIMRLKEEELKWKGAKHGWCAISFAKDALLFLNFKNHANYTILVSQYFSNSNLVQKFIFVIC